MDCSNFTEPDSGCIAVDSYLLFSLAGALLLIVIVQCIALIACGCFLKRKRQRTQEKGNLEFATNKKYKLCSSNSY